MRYNEIRTQVMNDVHREAIDTIRYHLKKIISYRNKKCALRSVEQQYDLVGGMLLGFWTARILTYYEWEYYYNVAAMLSGNSRVDTHTERARKGTF